MSKCSGSFIRFRQGCSAGEVTTAVDRLDRTIREELPRIRHIFIEAQSLGDTAERPSVDQP